MAFIEVQQLRVRYFQPDLRVRSEFVLKSVDDMAKGFHFLARHGDRVGEHLVARASAWRNFTPHSTMQRCCRGEREYRVEYSCHRLKDFLTLITFHALNFVSALKSRLFS